MRITASGEYMHAAPWNSSRFGNSNGSHGCVGMSTSNAIWLYGKVRSGDPVITTGSSKGMEQGNGYADWDISYAQFKKGSAAANPYGPPTGGARPAGRPAAAAVPG